MLGKIATTGQNGQFRTPRHIIRLMVEMVEPKPTDVVCDPACGTYGFLVAVGEYGTLLVTHGKTAAARRVLPMTPRVREVLESRWKLAGKPEEGWVWPAPTSSGHLEGSSKNNSTDSVSLNQAFVVLRPAKLDPKSDPEDLPSLRTRPPSWFPFLSNFPPSETSLPQPRQDRILFDI
jgi:N-6 DNA Methylase